MQQSSIIEQVGEETKNLMDKIVDDLSSPIMSLEDGILRDIKNATDETNDILRKVKGMEPLISHSEEISKLPEKLTQMSSIVSPLSEQTFEIKKNIEGVIATINGNVSTLMQLNDKMQQLKQTIDGSAINLKEKVDALILDVKQGDNNLKQELTSIVKRQEDNKKEIVVTMSEVQKSIKFLSSSLTNIYQDQKGTIETITSLMTNFIEKQKAFSELYALNELHHEEFEKATKNAILGTSEALEKFQTTLIRILNYVTPIWEKVQ